MARILILGGTRFLGRHIAEQALAAGHQLTLLHRGHSNAALFPQAQHLIADRDHDLSVLHGLNWDAAIDTSAYLPRQVQQVAAALAGRVGQYQLVSSISVYERFEAQGTTEDTPLCRLADPATENLDGNTYGGLKALCEAQAQALFGARCLVSRPGLLVGPHDPTGRFSWWVQRLLQGGDVLAPGDPDAPVQFIDARDAAAWMLLQVERSSTGVFNLNGPDLALTMAGLLHCARTVLNSQARLHWLAEDFLLAHAVAPWSELPVWLPRASQAMHRIDTARARQHGLVCRPLAQTLADTAAWLAGLDSKSAAAASPGPGPGRPAAGMPAERETRLLQAWQISHPASAAAD